MFRKITPAPAGFSPLSNCRNVIRFFVLRVSCNDTLLHRINRRIFVNQSSIEQRLIMPILTFLTWLHDTRILD